MEWTDYIGKVYVGDCLEFLRGLPDGCVDFAFADPPYNVGIDYGGGRKADLREDYDDWLLECVEELRRVSPRVCITSGIVNIWRYPPADWVISWRKPAHMKASPTGFNHWEPVLVYGKRADTAFRASKPDEIVAPTVHEDGLDWHPCPKPVRLLSELVVRYSPDGGTVLDPFLGSGTTAVACIRQNRVWLGSELSPDYAALAERRIARERERLQLPLSDPAPGVNLCLT